MYASSLTRDLTPLEEARRATYFVEQGYYSAYKLHGAVPGAIDDPSDQTEQLYGKSVRPLVMTSTSWLM